MQIWRNQPCLVHAFFILGCPGFTESNTGAGAREHVLTEILCTGTIKKFETLLEVITENLDKSLGRTLGQKSQNILNVSSHACDRVRLVRGGYGKMGPTSTQCSTQEASLNRSYCGGYSRTANSLSSVSQESYGYIESGLKIILHMPSTACLPLLSYSMKGAGTDESTLVPTVVTEARMTLFR